MIKKVFILIVCFFLTFTIISCKEKKLIKVKVAEVAHSLFYSPQYVAITNGYFEEEGLEIDLYNANGADKVTAALLSGGADIGLQGPEPTIYLYLNEKEDYLVNFLGLTVSDGSFIFGRSNIENFTLADLGGKTIIGGRKGGVPEMTLEYVLKEAGLTVIQNAEGPLKENEVNVRTDISFAAMAGAFLSGEGDFVTLFEPTATSLVNENKAYLLTALAPLAKEVTYTAYSTSIDVYNNEKEMLEKFTRAIYKGQKFVLESTDEEVATAIMPFFKEQSLKDLTSVVKRYREAGVWGKNPLISENGFNRLMDIMIEAKELEKKVSFADLVRLDIAKKVMNEK